MVAKKVMRAYIDDKGLKQLDKPTATTRSMGRELLRELDKEPAEPA